MNQTAPPCNFSSAGRASALQAEGHRFDPCKLHIRCARDVCPHLDVAEEREMLKWLTGFQNKEVIMGSNPIFSLSFFMY